MEQRSEEWFAARLGKVTASRIADLTARTKAGYGASRANYMAQLLTERLTGRAEDGFTSAAMQWGNDTEPQARAAYEFLTDNPVMELGFVPHHAIADAGASPDGLVGGDGMVEIKCPNTATHLDTLITETVPGKYIKQMQWQMACAQRQWCDFVSFDPRLPETMHLFVKRVYRDDAMIGDMEREVEAFLTELQDKIDSLTAKYGEAKETA